MIDFLQRVFSALMFRTDFSKPVWKMDAVTARTWLIISVFADLLAQFIASEMAMATLLLALILPAVLWTVPPRLSGALACLFCGQACVTILLAVLMALLMLPALFKDLMLIVWQVWCGAAMLVLVLKYIRTPKSAMAK